MIATLGAVLLIVLPAINHHPLPCVKRMRAVMRAHVRGAQRVTHARALQLEAHAMVRLGLCYALYIGLFL